MRQQKRILFLILSAGFILTILLTGLMICYEIDVLKETTVSDVNNTTDKIMRKLSDISVSDDKLNYLFKFNGAVIEEEFILEIRSIYTKVPFIQEIIFAPQIRNTHILAEQKKFRYAGYTGFEFKPFFSEIYKSSPFERVIFPVKYIQPFNPYTSIWFGRDLMTYGAIQAALANTIHANRKSQIVKVREDNNNIYYLFSVVNFVDKKLASYQSKPEDVFGLLGFKIDLEQLVKSSVSNDDLSLQIKLNDELLIGQEKYISGDLFKLEIIRKVEFEGQSIDLNYKMSDLLSHIDYRIPMLVFLFGIMLTWLVFIAERNHLARHKLLREQNALIEHKVSEKTQLLKAKTEQINKAYIHQVSISEELEAFSYSISHDLRAPLRSISGFTSLLEEDHGHLFDADARQIFDRIKNNALRMNALIDDMLSLSKVSRKTFESERFSMSDLVKIQAERCHEMMCDTKFDFRIQEDVYAEGDQSLLAIALTNLISNAIKYSSKSDESKIQFEYVEKNNEWVYLIRDNGVGFNMAYAAKLFSPFQRLHGEDFEGSGIGLATVQRVISRHGGKVWAESEPGKGACFYFTLS